MKKLLECCGGMSEDFKFINIFHLIISAVPPRFGFILIQFWFHLDFITGDSTSDVTGEVAGEATFIAGEVGTVCTI
jgi:hypothetical protein